MEYLGDLPDGYAEHVPTAGSTRLNRAHAACVEWYGDLDLQLKHGALVDPHAPLHPPPRYNSAHSKGFRTFLTLPQIAATLWHVLADRLHSWLRAVVTPHGLKSRADKYNVKKHLSRRDHTFYGVLAPLVFGALPPDSGVSLEPLDTDACARIICDTVAATLAMEIDARTLVELLTPMTSQFGPSAFLAHTIMRSPIIVAMLGSTLSKQLRVAVHCDLFGLQPGVRDDFAETSALKVELAAALQRNVRVSHACALARLGVPSNEDVELELWLSTGEADAQRHSEARLEAKTRIVQFALECRQVFKHVPTTLLEAQRVVHAIRAGKLPEVQHQFEHFITRWQLTRHMVALDAAIDALESHQFQKAMREGRAVGASWTSDESPPNCRRYVGMRFQISFVYWLLFKPESEWEDPAYQQRYPFDRCKSLCDIMQCPSKTGQGQSS